MAESKKWRKGSSRKHILLEYHCPIIHIAEEHWKVCSTKTELFEKLLGANIETTHRAAKGDLICKFVIKERKEKKDTSETTVTKGNNNILSEI